MNQDERFAKMLFSSVYPLYLAKILKKNRTEAELIRVINWLTGFDAVQIEQFIAQQVTFEIFFSHAILPPKVNEIKGVICGYRVEDITNPLTQKVRYLDKLVDELAQGKKVEKILRH